MKRKALAYTSDIILGRTGNVVDREQQKESIRKYAEENDIEVVEWFEDVVYQEDLFSRPGVQALLGYDGHYDLVLTERVWAFSRRWPMLKAFFAELDRRSKLFECSTLMFDCISQMTRRRFCKELAAPRAVQECVVKPKPERPQIRRPSRLHFASIKE